MNAYGYSRSAKIQCKFGCCQRNDAFKNSSNRNVNDRSRRKAARQSGKQEVAEMLK